MVEHLDFLNAVEKFESGHMTAQEVLETFVSERAKRELNLSQQAKNSFMKDNPLMQENLGVPRENVFSKLKKRVKLQLQEEMVPRFCKSKEYRTYMGKDLKHLLVAAEIEESQEKEVQVTTTSNTEKRRSISVPLFASKMKKMLAEMPHPNENQEKERESSPLRNFLLSPRNIFRRSTQKNSANSD